jgi:hypothetical protein
VLRLPGPTALLIALALLPAPVRAAGPDRCPEWGVEAGFGFTVHLNRGRSDEDMVLVVPSASFPLGSHFEYVIEGHLAGFFNPGGYMLGIMPLGVRYSPWRGRTMPYVSIGAGFGWTDLTQLDEIDRRFNFLLQGSLGVRQALASGQAVNFEARFSHISNAGTVLPNLGLNCVVFLVGWRFP